MVVVQAFGPYSGNSNTTNIAVTASNQTLTLPTPSRDTACRFANIGTQTIFLCWTTAGGSPVASASTSMPMLANTVETFTVPASAVVAAIAANTGSTLYLTPGDGS